MQIVYAKTSVKQIEKLDVTTKQRVKNAIERLPSGDVVKLRGYEEDYRLRVGDLRVIFSVKNDIITVKSVMPRGQAYKRL